MMQLLYGNATSLPKTLGVGQHGHISIIMTPQLYTTGITPTHATGESAAIRQTDFLEHKEEILTYYNHHTMEDALKSIIIDAVDKVYIVKLRNKYTGYLGITA